MVTFTSPKLPSLSKRPAHTLLFITEVKTFRIDTDRKGVLLSDVDIISHGCKSTANLAKAFTKIAENTAPPLGQKVWLLFLRLPNLWISLPTLQIQGVDDAMLTQALQFEAEGITGVSLQEMRVAFHFLKAENEMSDYWLVQIEQLAWDDLVKAVKKQKCQLAGLLHPGALPLALFNPQATEWLRLESWSTQVLALHRNESRFSVQAFGFDNSRWQTELENWLLDLGEPPPSETLINNKLEILPSTLHSYALTESGQVSLWLGLWAESLIAQRAAEVAVLKPTVNINVDITWMVGSGLAALLLCGLHAGWFMHQRAEFEGETARLTKVEKAITDMRKQITDNSAQKEKLDKDVNKLLGDADLIPTSLKMLQQRPALLLRALANGRQDQLIIESIDSQLQDVMVEGVALQQHMISQLVSYLSGSLQGLNWRVEAASIKNMGLFDAEAGPWSFKIKLVDEGIPGISDQAKNEQKK